MVLGNNKQEARSVRNYYAYYHALKTAFLTYQYNFDASAMPDPGDSQAYGRWSTYAQKRLEAEDHLSRVANITRGQIKKLATVGITTLTKLAQLKCSLFRSSTMKYSCGQRRKHAFSLRLRGASARFGFYLTKLAKRKG